MESHKPIIVDKSLIADLLSQALTQLTTAREVVSCHSPIKVERKGNRQ